MLKPLLCLLFSWTTVLCCSKNYTRNVQSVEVPKILLITIHISCNWITVVKNAVLLVSECCDINPEQTKDDAAVYAFSKLTYTLTFEWIWDCWHPSKNSFTIGKYAIFITCYVNTITSILLLQIQSCCSCVFHAFFFFYTLPDLCAQLFSYSYFTFHTWQSAF